MAAPPEETLEGLFAAMELTKYEIGSWFYARATHIVDPHNFYVVAACCTKHLPALNESQGQYSLEQLNVHQTVIYRSQALNRDVRGLVVDIKDNMSRIYALDHGFVEGNVCIERIFHPLNVETANTPSLARHCELYLCFPRGDHFSHDAIDAFKYYMGNERLKIYIQGKLNGKLRVIVYNSCPDDIATLLTTTGFTCFADFKKYTTKNTKVVHRPLPLATFPHSTIEVGESFEVRVQSGEKLTSFYVMKTSLYRNYIDTRQEFHSYCTGLCEICPENFFIGAPVGVKEHSALPYQRAIITEIIEPNSEAKVKLVDWGYDVVAPISRMKYVATKVFTDTPVYALYCAVVPHSNTPERLLSKGNNLRITVECVGLGFEKPHLVSISCVLN